MMLTDQIHAQPLCGEEQRTLKNDHLSRWGEQLVLQLTKTEDGYVGTFDIGLQIVIPEDLQEF